MDAQSAEGLAADVTSSLQRSLPGWPAVSSSIAGTYKGKTIDARVVGRELNVRYLVEGEVRAVGEQVMVRARVIETGTGT